MVYQKCSNCESEWNGIRQLEECPFCGFIIQIKNSDFEDIDEALNYIFGKHGFDIIKENHKLVSLLADYAPKLENERRLVRMALDAGVYTDLISVGIDDIVAQGVAKAKAIDKLNKVYFLDSQWATKVVSWFITQLSWDESEKTVEKSNQNKQNLCVVLSDAPEIIKSVSIGEYIKFGNYPQEDPKQYDLIEWEIIALKGQRALLLSRYCLDTKWYNSYKRNITWPTASLSSWLNKEFFNSAFSSIEQRSIIETELAKSYNPRSNAIGDASKGKVFILSQEELKEYSLDLSKLQCKATLLAKSNGAYYDTDTDFAAWWLRTPGYTNESAMYVMKSGTIDELGDKVDSRNKCVRPAIWVDYKMLSNIVKNQ